MSEFLAGVITGSVLFIAHPFIYRAVAAWVARRHEGP